MSGAIGLPGEVVTAPTEDGRVLDGLPRVDVLMGVGGTPEGVLAACAVGALGGALQGRLAPRYVATAAAA